MVRYADDFVILCRSPEEANQALAMVRDWTAAAGLTLHPTKTRIVDAKEDAFEFLGYRFEKGQTLPTSQEPEEAQGHDPSEDEAELREVPSGDHRVVESDAAWLVWVFQTQLQDDVQDLGRLDPDEAAKHPPKTTGPEGTWPRCGSSTLAECLLCRTRVV